MPLYDYECESCDKVVEIFCRYEDRDQNCDVCKSKMNRLPGIGFVNNWFKPGHFHAVGHYCGSERELRESAARQNIKLHRP